MPITASDKMTMMAKSESNTSADARLAAVNMRGRAACQMRSPVLSDRRPHQTMIADASAAPVQRKAKVNPVNS